MIDKKKLFRCFLFVAVWIGLAAFLSVRPVFADEPERYKINDLIDQANNFDGKAVMIVGEVIGDVMPRKGHVWLNIQDDSGVLGVWATGELAEQILVTGDYNYRGDIIEVAGVFSRADKELTGEICIKAQTIEVFERGHRIERKLNSMKIKMALLLSVLSAALLALRVLIRRRG